MPPATDARRVVLTGAGWVTPLGRTLDGVWAALLAGKSPVRRVTRFDASTFATDFAAEADDPSLAGLLHAPERFDGVSPHARFALAAAADAWRCAGLGDPSAEGSLAAGAPGLAPERVGIYMGAGEGAPDLAGLAAATIAGYDAETRGVDVGRWLDAARGAMTAEGELQQEPGAVCAWIAEAFGAYGPSSNCMTACAASTQAVGEAAELLRTGAADVMLAGGAHTMVHPLGMTGFIRLTAMSTRRDDPGSASRPFDRTRDGFVMGEGAGVVVLETLEHALGRGAAPLAEIAGFGSSADAFRITDIEPDGAGAQAAMRQALQQAGVDPAREGVGYISAHGTGTQENDAIESRAIRAVFGAMADRVPVSSVKSMLGHLIQAAGAVELITCLRAIQTGWLPPTVHLGDPDPACDLDYVPNKARRVQGGISTALSNSFGFGGQNDTIVLRRFDG